MSAFRDILYVQAVGGKLMDDEGMLGSVHDVEDGKRTGLTPFEVPGRLGKPL